MYSVHLDDAIAHSVLYLQADSIKARPKPISGRTSYLRVRLEFLRYPQVIRAFFTDVGSVLHGVLPPLQPAQG